MICPACSHEQDDSRTECAGCGLIFAKWESYQRRLREKAAGQTVQQKPLPVESGEDDAEDNEWASFWSRVAGWALIAGFCLPLLKSSLIMGQSFLIWPWDIVGKPGDAGRAAAMATISSHHNDALWALLPLVLGILILVLRRISPIVKWGWLLAALGFTALALLLIVFVDEAQILGLVFTPPTPGAGVMILLVVGAAALVVAANHGARSVPTAAMPRWVAGISGFMLGGITLLFFFASSDSWDTWPMWLFYALLVLVALSGLKRAFDPEPDDQSMSRIALLARTALVWGVLAMIIAQSTSDDGFVRYVVQADGGTGQTILGILKALLIYGGSALAMAIGLSIVIQRRIITTETEVM